MTARATRLLLWYPAAWRARYGDEFAELLAAELAERPRDRRRTVNVALSGVRARLADAGLVSHPLDHAAAARAGVLLVDHDVDHLVLGAPGDAGRVPGDTNRLDDAGSARGLWPDDRHGATYPPA